MARSLDSMTDVELLDRCRSGEERAWRALVRRYNALVYSTALRCGLDDDTASDVFQLVWTELYRSVHRIRDAKALPRWLIVSTRRQCFRAGRRTGVETEVTYDELASDAPHPLDLIEELEQNQRLEQALQTLKGRCERLLRLLFFRDPPLKYEQIAAELGIAIGSIGPIRARCLGRFRAILEGSDRV